MSVAYCKCAYLDSDGKLVPGEACVLHPSIKHTPGPWKVYQVAHPHHSNGAHLERVIGTETNDPQLKAPYPVVGVAVGIGQTPKGPAIHFTHIREEDAQLIAAAPELLALARQYASECSSCNGTGLVTIQDYDVELKAMQPCLHCEDIRAVIAKATGK